MAKLDADLNGQLVALIPGGRQVIVEGQDMIFMSINLNSNRAGHGND